MTETIAEGRFSRTFSALRYRDFRLLWFGAVTSTIGTFMQLLPKGFAGEPYRSTDGTIFVCVEGEGATKLDEETLEWSPGDVFVVPPWQRYAHRALGETTVLFGISDRPAQEALGIWREDR